MSTTSTAKSREEILKEHNIKPSTKFHEYEYLYRHILMAMEEYAAERHTHTNQALDELAERIKDKSDWNTLSHTEIEKMVSQLKSELQNK